MQNFFLYFYGVLFNLAGVLGSSASSGTPLLAMFKGQSVVTCLLIANNAAQVRRGYDV
jgi:hypothetical protein